MSYCCIKCIKLLPRKWKVQDINNKCQCLISNISNISSISTISSNKNEELYLMDLHVDNDCECITTPYICHYCAKQNVKLIPNYMNIECIVCHKFVKQCCDTGFCKIINTKWEKK